MSKRARVPAEQPSAEEEALAISVLPLLSDPVHVPLVLPAPVRRLAWENLTLPPGFEDLQAVSVVAAQPKRAAPGLIPVRRYRGRPAEAMGYCGLRHPLKALPCAVSAADSAADFHHYLALHPSPVIHVHVPLVLPLAWDNLSLPPGFEDLQAVSVVAAQPLFPGGICRSPR